MKKANIITIAALALSVTATAHANDLIPPEHQGNYYSAVDCKEHKVKEPIIIDGVKHYHIDSARPRNSVSYRTVFVCEDSYEIMFSATQIKPAYLSGQHGFITVTQTNGKKNSD